MGLPLDLQPVVHDIGGQIDRLDLTRQSELSSRHENTGIPDRPSIDTRLPRSPREDRNKEPPSTLHLTADLKLHTLHRHLLDTAKLILIASPLIEDNIDIVVLEETLADQGVRVED